MKTQIYKLILITFLMSTSFSYAQNDSLRNSTTVVLFGNGPDSIDFRNNKKYNASAVKFGVIEVTQGLYGLWYERELSSIFSIQVGAGVTGRNYTYGLITLDETEELQSSPNFDTEADIEDDDYVYMDRKSKTGYFFTVMPKFWYSLEDGMEDGYFAINFQHRNYKYLAYGSYQSNLDRFTSGPFDVEEFESQNIIALTWGSQVLKNKVCIDFCSSIGGRFFKGERRDSGYNNADNIIIGKLPRKTSGTKIFFEVGLKLGLWFDGK